MKKTGLLLASLLLFYFSIHQSVAQQSPGKAWQSHLDFANEGLNVWWHMHQHMSRHNRGLARAVADNAGKGPLFPAFGEIVTQGPRPARGVYQLPRPQADLWTNVRLMYHQTKEHNDAFSPTLASDLNNSRDEWMFLLNEAKGLCDTLYRLSRLPIKAYARQVEVLAAFSRANQRLLSAHRTYIRLSQKVPPYPEGMRDLLYVTMCAAELCEGVKEGKSSNALEMLSNQLNEALQLAYSMKEENMGLLQLDGFPSKDAESTYNSLIRFGEKIRDVFRNAAAIPEAFQQYPEGYFLFHQKLYYAFNHYHGGISTAFKQLTLLSPQPLPPLLELAPIFVVIPVEPGEALDEQEDSSDQPASPSLSGKPINQLVLLLDVSASMNQPDRLPLLKDAFSYLLEIMRPEDEVAIVLYSGEARVVLPLTSAAQSGKILQVLGRLRSGGKTQIEVGMRTAFGLLSAKKIPQNNQRVILATDGQFRLSAKLIEQVKQEELNGFNLSVMVFGSQPDPSRIRRLSYLAKVGGGNFAEINGNNVKEKLLLEAGMGE
ncbi:MAG: VWA domain-containing protein [Bacteroidota bacterium]